MRDYDKISDYELNKLCFVEADRKYITDVIEKFKMQIQEGKYKVIIKKSDDILPLKY